MNRIRIDRETLGRIATDAFTDADAEQSGRNRAAYTPYDELPPDDRECFIKAAEAIETAVWDAWKVLARTPLARGIEKGKP